MMQCRMCSQRLPRPGRLCRECDRELERARYAGVSIGELAPALPSVDASRMAAGGWRARLRSPGPVIAAAFSVGLVAAVALHVVDKSEAAVTHGSVMLDTRASRELRHVSIGDASPLPVIEHGETRASAPPVTPVAKMAAPMHAPVPRNAVIARHEASDAPAQIALAAAQPRETNGAAEPAGMLGDALAHCSGERFLARPACEERARARYCGDASASAQCATPERDHGQ
jgi:hypothetical protein